MYSAPMVAQSAIAKLLESMQGGGMRPTPAFNPNAPDPTRGLLANAPTPEQMLAQQLSQNPTQGGPPQAQPQQSPTQGLLAGPPAPMQATPGLMPEEPQGRGNLFQPAMDPALAARMDPNDAARAQPSVLRSIAGLVLEGRSPRETQRANAERIIADRDDATARAKAQRDEAELGKIREEAMRLYPTDPQAQVEYVAQSSAARIGGVTQATQAAVGLREREFAPQRVAWQRAPMMVSGREASLKFNPATGEYRWPDDTPLTQQELNEMRPMPPNPQYGSGTVLPGAPKPDGTPSSPQLVITSGPRMGETIAVPEVSKNEPTGRGGFGMAAMRSQSVELQSVIDNAQAAIAAIEAYPDAFGPMRASTTLNPHIDPDGNEARRLYGRLTSIVRHETFGTALSKNESQTARSWLGQEMDPPNKIIGDARNLLRWAQARKADIDGELQSLGTSRPAPAAPDPAVTALTEKYGLTPRTP